MKQGSIDYNDMLLGAQAEVMVIIEEVLEEMAMPMMIEALRLRWMFIPEEVKEQVRAMRPDIYNMVISMVAPT